MSEASQIVYRMETCKSYLQYAEKELRNNNSRIAKLKEDLAGAEASTEKLTKDVDTKRLNLQAALQAYTRAGVDWCRIEAVEQPKKETTW